MTVTDPDYRVGVFQFGFGSTNGGARQVELESVICPNAECRKATLTVSTRELKRAHPNSARTWEPTGAPLDVWRLIPPANIKPFPAYIPAPLLADYREACLIRDPSPKASATLSRRVLQGMIRHKWKVQVKSGRLYDEIDAIRLLIEPLVWEAIDALRKLGNIGAHMEKDIDAIVDVDPEEAKLLIGLIEFLFNQWYVVPHDRDVQLQKIVAAAAAK